jgi:tRNA threonylcarbamoyladenosine biosynthesis protein TsaE
MSMVIKMQYKITTYSEDDTIELAQNIESEKFPNMVICLIGDLGSGKTVFAKAFAKALGINDNITSPTFNIIKEYDGGEMKMFHMDVYRLSDIKQDLGIEEYFTKRGVCIIEWADLIEDILPKNRLDIKFKMVDENTRQLVITPHGNKYEDLCERVL